MIVPNVSAYMASAGLSRCEGDLSPPKPELKKTRVDD